ncbi:FMRFamide receptor-like isoform X1 [Tubulanus polymorphus]|uniref:FMRFamide receptor-like isoform X1 n=1 Tax=Tubulanus polymorphus TaxID=672921 RepID=UPI003DA62728
MEHMINITDDRRIELIRPIARMMQKMAKEIHDSYHMWELSLRSEFPEWGPNVYEMDTPAMKASSGRASWDPVPILDGESQTDSRYDPVSEHTNCTMNVTSTMMFADMRFYVYVILVGILCVFGILFNFIAIIVLSKDHRTTITFFLKALAVSDILSLLLMMIHHTFSSFYPYTGLLEQYYRGSVYMIPYIWPLRMTASTIGMLVITAITIDRYIRVCHPEKVHKWGKIRYARIVMVIIIVISIGINIPRFFVINTVQMKQHCTGKVLTYNDLTRFCKKNYALIYTLDSVGYFVPVLAMIIFNSTLMVKIQSSRRKQKQNNENYSGRATSNVTATLITIVVIFIICETPIRVYRLILHVHKGSAEKFLEEKRYAYIMQLAGDSLTTFHCFVNLFVFAFVGQRFRKILVHLLCCRRGHWQTYSSIASPRSRTFLLREHGYN